MLTKKEIFFKAKQQLNKQKQIKQNNYLNQLKTAASQCPEILFLKKKLKQTYSKLSRLILDKTLKFDEKSKLIAEIQNKNFVLQNKIRALIKSNGFSNDIFKPEPYCNLCNDVGYINHSYCSCIKNLIVKIQTEELEKHSCLKLKNFSEFNLNKYDKNTILKNHISEYDHMKAVKIICEDFSKNFPAISHGGLLMYGDTGLGKTHLSLAIASAIINKGFNVLYFTVLELLRQMSNYYFKNQLINGEFELLKIVNETDLLIIDDLGSEPQSNINLSKLFEIINIRTARKKPLILNTNLNQTEFEKRYNKRITSRVFNELKILKFIGTDNRKREFNPKLNFAIN